MLVEYSNTLCTEITIFLFAAPSTLHTSDLALLSLLALLLVYHFTTQKNLLLQFPVSLVY